MTTTVTEQVAILKDQIDDLRFQQAKEEKENGLAALPERLKNQVKGTFSESTPCDNRCMNARGLECTCVCAGNQHGVNFIKWALDFAPQFFSLWELLIETLEEEIDDLSRGTEEYWTPSKNDEVVFVKGRNLNKEGKLFWIGINKQGPGMRVGVTSIDGETIWDNLENVRIK